MDPYFGWNQPRRNAVRIEELYPALFAAQDANRPRLPATTQGDLRSLLNVQTGANVPPPDFSRTRAAMPALQRMLEGPRGGNTGGPEITNPAQPPSPGEQHGNSPGAAPRLPRDNPSWGREDRNVTGTSRAEPNFNPIPGPVTEAITPPPIMRDVAGLIGDAAGHVAGPAGSALSYLGLLPENLRPRTAPPGEQLGPAEPYGPPYVEPSLRPAETEPGQGTEPPRAETIGRAAGANNDLLARLRRADAESGPVAPTAPNDGQPYSPLPLPNYDRARELMEKSQPRPQQMSREEMGLTALLGALSGIQFIPGLPLGYGLGGALRGGAQGYAQAMAQNQENASAYEGARQRGMRDYAGLESGIAESGYRAASGERGFREGVRQFDAGQGLEREKLRATQGEARQNRLLQMLELEARIPYWNALSEYYGSAGRAGRGGSPLESDPDSIMQHMAIGWASGSVPIPPGLDVREIQRRSGTDARGRPDTGLLASGNDASRQRITREAQSYLDQLMQLRERDPARFRALLQAHLNFMEKSKAGQERRMDPRFLGATP